MPKKLKSRPFTCESNFHCCAEWHFAQFKSSRCAALIHPWALRISRRTGKFSVSAVQAAAYFQISRSTAIRAYGELADSGFFRLLEYGQFDSNVYQVLTHPEWCKEHIGLCAVRVEFPWTIENDPLGQRLWAASGGRVKFKQFQINTFRTLGVPDDDLVTLFTQWRDGVGKWRQPRNVAKHFLKHLRSQVGRAEKVLDMTVLHIV